jgi:hypothetical protein
MARFWCLPVEERQDLPGSRSDSITEASDYPSLPPAQWCFVPDTDSYLPLHTQAGRVLAKRAPLDAGFSCRYWLKVLPFSTTCAQ